MIYVLYIRKYIHSIFLLDQDFEMSTETNIWKTSYDFISSNNNVEYDHTRAHARCKY